MSEWLKPTVSPSDLILAITGEHPNGGNTPEAIRGRELHRFILDSIVNRRHDLIPEEIRSLNLRMPVKKRLP